MPPPPAAAKPKPAPEPAPAATREVPPPASAVRAAPARAAAPSQGMMAQTLSVEGFAGATFGTTRATVSMPSGTPSGGLGSLEVGGAPPEFRWGGRLSSPFYRIDRTATLEWLATLGLTHSGFRQELPGMTLSASSLGVELLPGLRARFEVLPQLSLTAEVGLGLQLSRTAMRVTFAGETAEGGAAGVFRLALGGRYVLDEKFSLFFEPVGLQANVGRRGAAGWSLQAGFAYAL